MGMFLNTRNPYEDYLEIVSDPYFVDKTALIKELIPSIGRKSKYICITRPRRFGKSVMANMVAAFLGKAADSRELFDGLEIAKCERGETDPDYRRHLNQHNIFYIDFSVEPDDCDSYGQYIARIRDGIKDDLAGAYPDIAGDKCVSLWDMLDAIFQKTGEKFVFVMDEWDAVFHLSYSTEEDKRKYLRFLRSLLKGKVYVELAYMTGVLPIEKYSSGSELNMFVEYDMMTTERFHDYFGFTDLEVDRLYSVYRSITQAAKISRDDLTDWYDGYYTVEGSRMYNPRSVVCALANNQIKSYWTGSGPCDEIFYYIRHNIEAVREDLVLMLAGEGVKIRLCSYAAVSMNLNTKDEIYSAMVVYGLLTYKDGKVYIPNRELMGQFGRVLMTKESLGYVYRLARESERMMEATLAGDTETMKEILQYVHNTESPIFTYNSEVELSAVVNLVYLAARDEYRVERESKAGKGYVDFLFYPERRDADAVILELKVDGTPEQAIAQIKEKGYALAFEGKTGENRRYTGRILAVGISYDRKKKEHFCKVETL